MSEIFINYCSSLPLLEQAFHRYCVDPLVFDTHSRRLVNYMLLVEALLGHLGQYGTYGSEHKYLSSAFSQVSIDGGLSWDCCLSRWLGMSKIKRHTAGTYNPRVSRLVGCRLGVSRLTAYSVLHHSEGAVYLKCICIEIFDNFFIG